jgi:hypothetical protein
MTMARARHRVPCSDRRVAAAILARLARHPVAHHDRFCLSWSYDYDCDYLFAVARDLGLPAGFPADSFLRRLRRVCRRLEVYGLLAGRVASCHAEYLGEPRTLKSYTFGKSTYHERLAPDLFPWYTPLMSPEGELDFLLDRAFPPGHER